MYDFEELKSLGLNYSKETFSNGTAEITIVIFDKTYEDKIIGLILSDLFDEMIPIVIEETDGGSVDFASLGCAKDGKHLRISFDKSYMGDLQNKTDEVLTIIFHELGHLKNGDLTNGSFNFEKYHDERTNEAQEKHILPMEIGADDFAVGYIGSARVASGLKEIKRRTETYDGYENVDLAVWELEERIKRLL